MTIKNLQKYDPLKKQATVNAKDMGNDLSPMSPPDAFEPPAEKIIPYENLHPFFQELYNEHKDLKEKIKDIKEAFTHQRQNQMTREILLNKLTQFLQYFHQEFIPHNRKEESTLFPLLNKKLLVAGEHSPTKIPFTGVKILLDDHIHAIRIGGVLSHLHDLMRRLDHAPSQEIVFGQIKKHSLELFEILELHIFREDHIIFGLAQELLDQMELDEIHKEFN